MEIRTYQNTASKFENNTHDDEYRWPILLSEHLEKCLVGPHPMWRKEIHSEIGFFDEHYIAVGDQEFWLRIGEKYNIYSYSPIYRPSMDN